MAARKHKYGAKKTVVDGITFASRREARRYAELLLLERAGQIRVLQVQVSFPLSVNGVLVCTYVADFRYTDVRTGERIVEDSKGFRTPAYKIKRKLMKALYGIDILET